MNALLIVLCLVILAVLFAALLIYISQALASLVSSVNPADAPSDMDHDDHLRHTQGGRP